MQRRFQVSQVGNHISIDEYSRYWFSLGSYGVKIFDDHKSLIGTLQPNGSDIFDTLFVDSCVHVLIRSPNLNRIIRHRSKHAMLTFMISEIQSCDKQCPLRLYEWWRLNLCLA